MYMAQDDACDTGLALGMGYIRRSGVSTDHCRRRDCDSSLSNPQLLEPSLTLNLSDDAYGPVMPRAEVSKAREEVGPARVSPPRSTVSSFSTAYPSSVKREKDMMADEEEEEEGSGRKKLRLTKEQSALLEDRFKVHSTLNPKQKQALAKQLNLRPRQVEVWFQNRRARSKLKQTEVDSEILRRWCETLTDENRRLQKEMKELRVLKFTSPPAVYMQLPAATLTMCPSCEKIGCSVGSKGGRPGPFVVGPEPQFFNPFTDPAGCLLR